MVVDRLASYVVAYIECDVQIGHALRRAFDFIDCFQREGRYLNRNNRPRHPLSGKIFRQQQVAELCLNEMPFVSPSAREMLSNYETTKNHSGLQITCDHVIPVRCMEQMLRDAHSATPLTPDYVLEFHSLHFRRAIIAREENAKLNLEYRHRMPDSWNGNAEENFARYHAVGFDWAADWK